MQEIDEDFVQFCRQATDAQLENILTAEYSRHDHGDFAAARIAAAERGWSVATRPSLSIERR